VVAEALAVSARALLALLAILGVLLAVVLWLDKPHPMEDDSKSLAGMLPKTLSDVKALEIEGKQAPLRVERDEAEGWRLVLPFGAEADPHELESFYGSLTGTAVTRVVEETGGDAATFGLAPPEGRLRVFPKDGSAPKELRVGRASPVGDGRYLADGSGRILLVGGAIATALERAPDSLRERRMLPVTAEKVRQLTVEGEKGHSVLVRDGDKFRVALPVEDQADDTAADSWIRAAVELRAVDFPASSVVPADAFAQKALTLTVLVEGDTTPRVVEIGSLGPEGKRWARRATGDFVALVDTAALAVLERDPSELRDARIFAAEPKDVRAVIVEGGGAAEISARRAGEDGAWSITGADGSARAAAPRAIEDLIDRVKWLRAVSFDEPKAGLRELRTLIFRGEQGDLGRIDVFAAREAPAGAEQRLYLQSSWRPGLTLGVKAETLGTLPSKADDLVARTVDASTPSSSP